VGDIVALAAEIDREREAREEMPLLRNMEPVRWDRRRIVGRVWVLKTGVGEAWNDTLVKDAEG